MAVRLKRICLMSRSGSSISILCGKSMMKPEFRPDALRPTRWASIRTTLSLGFSSPNRRAAAKPENPAPTTTQSAV